jgi:GT2 family glycosyltransferase
MAFDALREGRLPLSPRRWLLDLRHLRAQMAKHAGSLASQPRLTRPRESGTATQARADSYRVAMVEFIRAGAELRFAPHDRPTVSVLLVLHNRVELTLRCLQALRDHLDIPIELVIVDNHSTDETPALLDRVHGARIIRPGENLGFLRACNLAARTARGTHLLFLNNDTEVQPGSLSAALETIEGSESVGAVGGRLIYPDGRLQEAGSIVWNDGSCLGYGRGESPWDPQYSYVRDVDYCSAAFLLTRRELFLELGGFDDRYQPAYYEDADYCVRVWKTGRRVVYQPRALVTHVEFGSLASVSAAATMQRERRAVFVDAHRDWLVTQATPSPHGLLRARDRRPTGQRILVIDDRVPRVSFGFGDPRTVALLRALVGLGHSVTLFPVSPAAEEWSRIYEDIPEEVEVLIGYGPRRIAELFRERDGYYDGVLVSRSHNMALLRAKMGEPHTWMRNARIIYDAEAITALRDVRRRRLLGENVREAETRQLVAAELDLARGTDAVLAVSEEERRQFEGVAPGRVHVVSHAVEVISTTRSFHERTGLLFVGSFHEMSPNADAVLWFIRQVLPILRKQWGGGVPLTVVGQDPPHELLSLNGAGVSVLGSVPDLGLLYDGSRVFVAPTRFASGIPLKVIHAAAHGLPVVSTSLLARQLEWRHGQELLAADSAEDFAAAVASLYQDPVLSDRVRTGALNRVRADYSMRGFAAALNRGLSARDRDEPASLDRAECLEGPTVRP